MSDAKLTAVQVIEGEYYEPKVKDLAHAFLYLYVRDLLNNEEIARLQKEHDILRQQIHG